MRTLYFCPVISIFFLLTCPDNIVNFGPLAAEICWRVWGTPVNFNGCRILAALLHVTLVVGVNQTLWRWTEGATYISQGGHHVGHWPTFQIKMCFVPSLAKQHTVLKWKDTISAFPVLQGSAEQLGRWGGKAKHCLISYFLSNTSAKNYRNRVMYVKIIASQRWGVFWDTVYIQLQQIPRLNSRQVCLSRSAIRHFHKLCFHKLRDVTFDLLPVSTNSCKDVTLHKFRNDITPEMHAQ